VCLLLGLLFIIGLYPTNFTKNGSQTKNQQNDRNNQSQKDSDNNPKSIQ
jgi:hypothetical protein